MEGLVLRRPPRWRAPWPRSVAAILTASLLGCGSDGPPRAPVSGSVAVGVEPLKAGVIRFVPVGGTTGPAAVATVHEGRYELPVDEGPVVGSHRVEVEGIDHFGFALDDEAAFTRHAVAHRGRLPPNPVPAIYRGARSPLSADVPPDGLPACDFILNPKGSPPARR